MRCKLGGIGGFACQASDFSRELELSGQVDDTFECYFNRGLNDSIRTVRTRS